MISVERAQQFLLKTQKDDGRWDGASELGPSCTAQVLIALRYMQRLSPEDLAAGRLWLRRQQRKDGSFPAAPFAAKGDVGTTACAATILDGEAAQRAWAFVDVNGGKEGVKKLLFSGDVSAVYLLMAGAIDSLFLPPVAWVLIPKAVDFAMTKLNYSIVLGSMAMGLIGGHTLGKQRAVDIISEFQNESGSFNAVSIATSLFGSALYAAGAYERANKAADWLLTRAIRDKDGLHFDIFPSDLWTTAYHVRVLVESGIAGEPIERGVRYLLKHQANVPQPRYNNRRAGAILSGGWAFEAGNPIMPDPDDTGMVLTSLGTALPTLSQPLAAETQAAIQRGRKWVLGMQNPDGGWPGYAWGLPGKQPGPAMMKPTDMMTLGDPSTEDLTARVLDGLACTGSFPKSAVSFLQEQQCTWGAWWGRWVVNYLAGTAYVLSALARAGEDLDNAYIKRALDWTLEQQNKDGGFGETTETYVNPKLAGRGPSTPALTGLVVTALVDCGLGDRAEVKRAIDYLVRTQRADGTWPNLHYVATALPPGAFYTYAPAANYLPLQALAKFERREVRPSVPPTSRWSDAVLDPMRHTTDPLADELVARVYLAKAEGKVNPLLMQLFKNDDPIPLGLPREIAEYFEQTAALPAFADKKKVARAQKLFETFGVQITMGLFCSSLPQAYAAANGAAVLVQTQAMQRNTRQRIFETAQFIFDVLDDGAFEPNGRGIRAAQRVRLMHAAIRHLVLRTNNWDASKLGKPINQEDMAGTLMTFSACTFDALKRYGAEVTDEDAEAWIHAWMVIGHYMGIEPSLMPTSYADAEALMDAIRRRQWAPSTEGQALTTALLDMMDKFFTFDIAAFDGFIPTQIRFLAGDHCADLIGVPQSRWEGLLGQAAKLVGHDEDDFGRVFGEIAQLGMRSIVLAEREGKQASFRLPTSLRKTVLHST